MKSKTLFILVCCFAGLIVGCATSDGIMGGSTDPSGIPIPPADGGASGGFLGGILGLLLPGGLGTALGGLSGRLYWGIRMRKYRAVIDAMIPAVDEIMSLIENKKSPSADEVKEILIRWQEELSAKDEVDKIRA